MRERSADYAHDRPHRLPGDEPRDHLKAELLLAIEERLRSRTLIKTCNLKSEQ